VAALGLACTRILIEAETAHGERLSRLWRHDGPLTPGAMAERVRWQLDGWLTAGGGAGSGGAGSGGGGGGGAGGGGAGGGAVLVFDEDGRVQEATVGETLEDTTAGLVLLRLAADEVAPDDGRQIGFWGGEAAADERADRALARLQGLLGPEAVVTAVVGGGRSPAERVRLVPWGDPRQPALPCAPVAGETPPWPGRVPAPAPATVHADPAACELVGAGGEPVVVGARGLPAGTPVRLSVAGGPWAEVVAWAGPWPADERWWDPPAHRRRARLQVQLAGGDAHLLALEHGRWSVEATYD
jgi:protein ImuB